MAKIIVFAPHPDDESIGCGGSIAKHVKKGDRATAVFFTSGGSTKREGEAKTAAKILGISKTVFLRFKDGFLSYTQETVEKTAKILAKERPAVIYVPHASENDADHRNAFRIVHGALTKSYIDNAPIVLCYEVWTPIQTPNYYEDIGEFVKIKKKAILSNASQMSLSDYARAALSLNVYRGIMSHKGEYCEAFSIASFGGKI